MSKVRNEIQADIDPELVFDLIGGLMLYAQIFQPTEEPWEVYIRRTLKLFLQSKSQS